MIKVTHERKKAAILEGKLKEGLILELAKPITSFSEKLLRRKENYSVLKFNLLSLYDHLENFQVTIIDL